MTMHTHNSVGYKRVEEGMTELGCLPTYLIYHPNLPTARFPFICFSFLACLYKSTGRAIAVTTVSTSVSALLKMLKIFG